MSLHLRNGDILLLRNLQEEVPKTHLVAVCWSKRRDGHRERLAIDRRLPHRSIRRTAKIESGIYQRSFLKSFDSLAQHEKTALGLVVDQQTL